VLRAARPQLFGIKTGRIVMLSSPNGVGGAMHRAFERHYGKPGAALFWRASALVMRPDLLDDPQMVALRDDDPTGFDQEVLAEFTAATGALIEPSKLAEAVREGGTTAPAPRTRYEAAFDVGGRRDGSAGVIAHRAKTADGRTVVHVDGVWHWPAPHLPEAACKAFAPILKSYGIRKVHVDRGKDDVTRIAFEEAGLRTIPPDGTTTDNHVEMAHAIENGRVSLPRHDVLLRELRGLRRARGGVDHASSGHDDAAAAAAHVVAVLLRTSAAIRDLGISIGGLTDWLQSRQQPKPEPQDNGIHILTPNAADNPVAYRAWSKAKAAGEDTSRWERRVRRVYIDGRHFYEVPEDYDDAAA
jgi:hypothetical protein